MMQGVVNQSCEATISLVVGRENRQNQLIDAVIDTGYTGFLSLPRAIIVNLNLPWTGIDRGTLGDGSEVTFEVYAATLVADSSAISGSCQASRPTDKYLYDVRSIIS